MHLEPLICLGMVFLALLILSSPMIIIKITQKPDEKFDIEKFRKQ